MKVCIVTEKHISDNPRVWKEANALTKAGYGVSVVTQFLTASSLVKDRELLNRINASFEYKPGISLVDNSISKPLLLFFKVRRKLALILKKLIGYDSIYLLAYAPARMYKAAENENADIYLAHVEQGTLIGNKLAKAGYKVAYDIEDWYSRDYLVPTRPVGLLKKIEAKAMKYGLYIACPSESMAQGLHETYGIQKPVVIYNSFPDENVAPDITFDNSKVSLVWFSQTVGAGRGLEELVSVLNNVTSPVVLTLIGHCSETYAQKLGSIFPSDKHELRLIPPVKHHELYSILKTQDIGLALEQPHCDSRETTITNKILQYLQSGLKVFATDTKGQREVAEKMGGTVQLVSSVDNSEWAQRLELLIKRNDVTSESTIKQYNDVFSWDKQEHRILELVKYALAK